MGIIIQGYINLSLLSIKNKQFSKLSNLLPLYGKRFIILFLESLSIKTVTHGDHQRFLKFQETSDFWEYHARKCSFVPLMIPILKRILKG
jgi:hypothetical protein